jgi:hypothetical protein
VKYAPADVIACGAAEWTTVNGSCFGLSGSAALAMTSFQPAELSADSEADQGSWRAALTAALSRLARRPAAAHPWNPWPDTLTAPFLVTFPFGSLSLHSVQGGL